MCGFRRPVLKTYATLLFSALATATVAGDVEVTSLQFIASTTVFDRVDGLREPSGLALAADGKHFWTISDGTSRIFSIGLDGKLDPSRTIKVEMSGPEGITEDAARRRLLAVSENSSEIVVINLKNEKSSRIRLRQIKGYISAGLLFTIWRRNNGLEGITVDPATGSVFVLKEKSPRLILELSSDLSQIRGSLMLSAEMGFVDDRVSDMDLDVSGIVYDPTRRAFWITSDTAKRIYLFDPATRSAKSWTLRSGDGNRRLANVEGVALSRDGQTLYVVSDDSRRSQLVSYRID